MQVLLVGGNNLVEKKDIFIEKMQKIFGPKHVRIMQHLYAKPPVTFRINTNQISTVDALKELKNQGFNVKHGPFTNSYVVARSPENLKLSETELVNQGKVYIQGVSSMVPVLMLNPQESDRILDLCAAPGSKTSHIALLTKGQSQIIAVDNNRKRIYKLEENLHRQKFSNVEIINNTGVGLEKKYKNFNNYFDKVLLDAPCTNEGLVCLADPDALKYWYPKLPKRLSKLQKKLVVSAINMLKPGGTMVYSTCTYSKEENENVVAWVLARFKNMSLVELKKIFPDGLFTGFFAAKLVKLE